MGKVLYVDPNPEGQDVVQHEDLSIFVELVTTKKSRSEINVDGPNKNIKIQKGGKRIPVKFLNGTDDDGDGKSTLTTHYTEITTKFGADNADLETFGITSIDIDFNTSYTPMVKINFTDIRGRLFEMGADSPYNVFFNLPYPIFELTVKGYYGKAVTYCLHLTKFTGKLNDKTGNFEVQCDFVGYTYAFLADMLMGYLRGISETDMAKEKIKESQERFLAKGDVFLSFNELDAKVKSLNKEILKLKSDDERVAELALAQNVMIRVAKLKDGLRQLLNNLTGIRGPEAKKTIEIYNDNRFALIREADTSSDKGKLVNADIERYKNDHNNNYRKQIEELNDMISNLDFQLDPKIFELKINKNYGEGVRKIDFQTEALSGDTTDLTAYNNQNGQESKPFGPLPTQITTKLEVIGHKFESNEEFLEFRRRVYSLPESRVSNVSRMTYFDLQLMFETLDNVTEKLRLAVKDSKENLANELVDKIETTFGVMYKGEIVKFSPSIKNMIRILTEHVHILMKCIKETAEQVKTSQETKGRETQLKGLVVDRRFDLSSDKDPQCGFGKKSESEEDSTLNDILPFPDYKEREKGVFEDKWIGNKAPTMPEVEFIEQLLEGLIQAKKKDGDLLDELEFGEDEWFPINPFDTKFMTGFENPWKTFKDSIDPDEVIGHVLSRASIFLGYSHKSLSDKEIEVMAKLEANNCFNSIETPIIRRALSNYTGQSSAQGISSKIISFAGPTTGDANPSFANSGAPINKGKFFGKYSYNKNALGLDTAGFWGNIINTGVELLVAFERWKTNLILPEEYEIPEVDLDTTVVMAEYQYIPFTNNVAHLTPEVKVDIDNKPITNEYSPEIRYYLPLSTGVNKDKSFFKGESLIGVGPGSPTLDFRKGLRAKGNIFFGSFAGGNTNKDPKPDDGSTTIEFINRTRYDKISQGEYPSYAEGLFEDLPFNEGNVANTAVLDLSDKDNIPSKGLAEYSGMFAGRWKTHEFFDVKLPEPYEGFGDTLPSWVTFYQNTTQNRPIFTSLRKTNEESGVANQTPGDIEDPRISNIVVGTSKNNGKIKAIADRPAQKELIDARGAKHFGKSLSNLLTYEESGNANVALPFLNFRMYSPEHTGWVTPVDANTLTDSSNTQFATFGSDLYFQQDVEGKAYLFLHSLPWNGMVYNFGDGFFGTWGNAFNNLFNFYDTCGAAGEETDESSQCNRGGGLLTHDTQHFFNQRAGFVEAPALWIAFVGGLLWRQKQDIDPIKWSNGDYSYLPLTPEGSTISSIPTQEQYCLPNIITNEVMGFLSAPNDFAIETLTGNGELIDGIVKFTNGLANLTETDKTYVNVERPLDRLPDAMANQFIDFFLEFAQGKDFEEVRMNYDMFLKTDGSGNFLRDSNQKLVDITEDERIELWLNWNKRMEADENTIINTGIDQVNGGPNELMGYSSDGLTYIGDTGVNPNLAKNYVVACRDNKFASYFFDETNAEGNVLWDTVNPMYIGYEDASNLGTIATRVQGAKNVATLHDKGSPFNFFLEMRDDTPAQKRLYDRLIETRVIVNSSWRLWAANAETVVDSPTVPFRFDTNQLVKYINAWSSEYHRISLEANDLLSEEEDAIKKELFNSIDADDIKLQLYKNIKSIYDKWVPGSKCELELCGGKTTSEGEDCPNLIDTFRFIDRGYNEIGNEFLINPIKMVTHMVEDYNISFYDYLARNLADNNFDFIPLPTFINYNKQEEVEAVFTPSPFNTITYTSGPQFVCMYIGERSKNLNLGEQSGHQNDGFSINPDNNCLPSDYIGDTDDVERTRKNLIDSGISKGLTPAEAEEEADKLISVNSATFIPAFRVAYGDQNQSMFTNFKLDQQEFTETDESLQIIDEIASDHGPNNPSSGGQNLFNVWRTRSYSAMIDSLGNAQIQPFMYFELDNVPMFAGAYTIIHTKHSIKPNHMKTQFKGVRIRKSKTKMIEKSTIFMNLIGSLSDVDTEGVDLDGLEQSERYNEGGAGGGTGGASTGTRLYTASQLKNKKGAPGFAACITYQVTKNKGLIVQSEAKLNDGSISPWSLKEVGEFVEHIGLAWYSKANTETFTEALYYNDLSLYGGGDHPHHQSHEEGRDIDFRMIRNDKKNGSIEYTSPEYNQEQTIKLIEMIIDESILWIKNKPQIWGTNPMIEQIYFNDPAVISHFASYKGFTDIVKRAGGHDNHIHLRLAIPKIITDDAVNNYAICDGRLPQTNDNTGQLSDLPFNRGNRSKIDRLGSLGKI
jgi:hypothetical protein